MNKILVVDDDKATRHRAAQGSDERRVTRRRWRRTASKRSRRSVRDRFDLLLLDVWMPRMNGLELLAKLRIAKPRPRVVVMTSDDAPETLLKAVRAAGVQVRAQAGGSRGAPETVRDALAAPEPPPIEVISARPEWVELVVPCTREAAGRIETVMAHLDANLAPEVRESIGYAFRELLLNAVEWGGKLDPTRTVRIACLRARRMLMYRIADPGPASTSRICRTPRSAIRRTIRSRTCTSARRRAFAPAVSAC